MAERSTSDHEFVRQFSPRVLDQLPENAFDPGIHVFRSAPGGGKTTLLRAFTPSVLRAFWNASSRRTTDLSESLQRLVARGAIAEDSGPAVLGIFLSCSSGYADLPPAAQLAQEGTFRALLDCRVVLRTLRSVATITGIAPDALHQIRLAYPPEAEFQAIPRAESADDLYKWAESLEQGVYAQLDGLVSGTEIMSHVRFESLLWLQAIKFYVGGQLVSQRPLLMLDDLHALRRRQRALLIDEFISSRPQLLVWLAERRIAMGDELLSEGAREGRELMYHSLEEMWGGTKGPHHFAGFAQNVLDRRLRLQDVVEAGSFSQCLQEESSTRELEERIVAGIDAFRKSASRFQGNARYTEWLDRAARIMLQPNRDAVVDLYVTRILLSRQEGRKQLSLELALSAKTLEELDSSQVRAAAEIFLHEEVGLPYYFGIDRLCQMATTNIEELLFLSASLFVGIQAKQILRNPEPLLTPVEQEKLIKEAVTKKRQFIPKNHSEGLRAQRLLDGIAAHCRDRTFLPNAPYAPGVTGVRLSQTHMESLVSQSEGMTEKRGVLRRVLTECAAENLLVPRSSQESTSREGGTVFYLNRSLCAYYDLPLQYGGWQDVSVADLMEWMERGPAAARQRQRGLV